MSGYSVVPSNWLASSYRDIPILSIEEEQTLFKQYLEDNDLEAVRKIVMSNMRFVAYIALKYKNYGVPIDDMMHEGAIGLMKAAKRFDPAHGVRFISFAIHDVKNKILDYVIRNYNVVKSFTTKAQRKLFFNRKLLPPASIERGFSNAELAQISIQLNVPVDEIKLIEQQLLPVVSSHVYEDTHGHDDERHPLSYHVPNSLVDNGTDPFVVMENEQEEEKIEHLRRAINQLNDRCRDIMSSRHLTEDPATLWELAEKHGISAERVRQLEVQSIEKIKTRLATVRASYS